MEKNVAVGRDLSMCTAELAFWQLANHMQVSVTLPEAILYNGSEFQTCLLTAVLYCS